LTVRNADSQDMEVRLLKDHAFCKVYSIPFPAPLLKGQAFRLNISCRWDNAFSRSRQYDYVFSAWGAYAIQGIDRLVGRVVSDVPLSHFVLERLEGEDQRIKDPVQPKHIETGPQRHVLEWEITNPRHVFLLTFRKEV
jgi:hypothetical protein